ncbi:MAG: leucine-rich repeat protein [Clostridia bacterium]|nr:leucine-rich repeat protein [Clostridia bacterium]
MKTAYDIFSRAEALFQEEHSLREWQELFALAERISLMAKGGLEKELRYACDDVSFFENADPRALDFGQCGDHVYFKITDSTLHIGGSGAMWDFDAPYAISDKQGIYPPWKKNEFDTVIIQNGVTSIGCMAFCDSHLSTVMIPASVKRIGAFAFFNATVNELTLPETLETVEEGILCAITKTACKTLILSSEIPDLEEDALFNRDGIVADTVIFTGETPADPTLLMRSGLFSHITDDTLYCPHIRYPKAWDLLNNTFCEGVLALFPTMTDGIREELQNHLFPYDPS